MTMAIAWNFAKLRNDAALVVKDTKELIDLIYSNGQWACKALQSSFESSSPLPNATPIPTEKNGFAVCKKQDRKRRISTRIKVEMLKNHSRPHRDAF